MYLRYPERVEHTATCTARAPKTECEAATSTTRSATFTKAKSATYSEKKGDFALKSFVRPTDGSWREIKRSGSIKMTPMEHINELTTYEVGRMNVPYIAGAVAAASNTKAKVNGVCTNCRDKSSYDVQVAIAKGRYVEQGDLDYWKTKYFSAPHYVLEKDVLDSNKVEAAKSSVYAELFQAYNLGEEIAELRETIHGVLGLTKGAIRLIGDAKNVITSLLEKDKVQLASEKWMEFRYGIMPIYYSINDLLDLNKDSGNYRTTRQIIYPEIPKIDDEDRPDVYFHEVGAIDTKAYITAKARWSTVQLKKFDLININPLTTFTAVLPWSMVVRWFFNVQSYLDCRVKSLTSLALESCACVAIREKHEYGTYLSARVGYENQYYHWTGNHATCGSGYFPPVSFGPYTDKSRQEILLARHTVNNYKRYIFQPSDVKLVYSPHMTWQRNVDGLVLMMGSMSKLLRRFK